jgi:pre-60S factor REI1
MSSFASPTPSSSGLACYTAPGVTFATAADVKKHYQSDWHRYNLKRKVGNLPPISKQAFARRVAAALRLQEQAKNKVKKTDHLKRKESDDRKSNAALSRTSSSSTAANNSQAALEEKPLEELTVDDLKTRVRPEQSIFDDREFGSIEENLEYMRKKYQFIIPDLQYVSDVTGLLRYCSAKVRLGRICLYCNRQFKSVRGCQAHMRDMFHCRMNAGNIDDFFEEFADYYEWPVDEDGEGEVAVAGEDVREGERAGEAMEVEEAEEGGRSPAKKKGGYSKPTVEVLPSGELIVTGKDGKRKLVGTREFNTYYKQNIRPEDTRDAVQAQRKEVLLLAYKAAGVNTTTSDEKALSLFVKKQRHYYTGAMLTMARGRDKDIQVQKRRVDKNKNNLLKHRTYRSYRGEGVGIHG